MQMTLQELVLEQRTGMEQVSTFAGLDVLIAAHGAGVTNIIFMLPNSALYELFPPQWKFACYRRLAGNVGVLYAKDMARWGRSVARASVPRPVSTRASATATSP